MIEKFMWLHRVEMRRGACVVSLLGEFRFSVVDTYAVDACVVVLGSSGTGFVAAGWAWGMRKAHLWNKSRALGGICPEAFGGRMGTWYY